ncbi:hypothetical protein BREVNS_2117 [Brevinematales bacterium NS]|nr:hypothetical protein BREVNS_2117 [Brevinematales bacterium NS]
MLTRPPHPAPACGAPSWKPLWGTRALWVGERMPPSGEEDPFFLSPPFFLYPTSTSLSIHRAAFAVMKRALWFPTGKSFRREDTGGVRGDLFCCSARKAHRSVAAGPPLWRGIGGARWALCFRSQEDEVRSPTEKGLPRKEKRFLSARKSGPCFVLVACYACDEDNALLESVQGRGRGFRGVAPDPDRGRKHLCKGLKFFFRRVFGLKYQRAAL